MKPFPLFTLLTALSAATAAHADRIDDVVRAEMQRQKIPGASIAVVRDGKIVKTAGYGLANVETGLRATPTTIYQLASVTKQFTATGVLLLIEDGALTLDTTLGSLLPDVPAAWHPVTVRQLLNHTSGIKSYTSVDGFDKTLRKDFTPKELLALVADAPLEFAPGSRFAYNNTGYFLLGLILEKVSGQSYGAFLEKRIFHPLGMTHTRVNDLSDIVPGRAQGYTLTPQGLKHGAYTSPTQPFSAGALLSSVEDQARWHAALDAGKVLKKSSWDQAWTPTVLADGTKADYGFGWELSAEQNHRAISHGGGIPGFSTHVLRLPDDYLDIVVLTNLDGGGGERISKAIARSYIPALIPPTPKAIADPEPEVTERLKALVLQIVTGGTVERKRFTPALQERLFPDRIQGAAQQLGSLGALSSFALVKRDIKDELRELEFRAQLGTSWIRVFIGLTRDEKIAGLGFRPE
jgi:CubicO group peptidase (beta-lactamase class C family)